MIPFPFPFSWGLLFFPLVALDKITIEENRFITKVYHKVDDFDFEVVSFPLINMSDQITYNLNFILSWLDFLVCSKFNYFDIRSKIYWKFIK